MTGRTSVLGEDIEQDLVNWLLEIARRGAPIPKLGLLFSVRHLCQERGIKNPFKDDLPGKSYPVPRLDITQIYLTYPLTL